MVRADIEIHLGIRNINTQTQDLQQNNKVLSSLTGVLGWIMDTSQTGTCEDLQMELELFLRQISQNLGQKAQHI